MPLRYLFVDMNAYFASVEQHLRPELRGRPVGVVAVDTDSTSCIAASYEAKPFGVKTGTPVWEAKLRCPGLIIVEARPPLYVEFHHRIVELVESCLHVTKVVSIDEVACRLPANFSSQEQATGIAHQIKAALRAKIGPTIRCSVGIGPNCFLGKVASDMQKPNGLVVLRSEELKERLFPLVLRDLPGIGPNMHRRLSKWGVESIEQLWNLSADVLATIWGGIGGRQFWHHLHGDDWPDVPTHRRTVGHSHVLPPELRNDAGARSVLVRLIHKAAVRLVDMGYLARNMALSVTFADHSHWGRAATIGYHQDVWAFMETMDLLWQRKPAGNPKKVGVTFFGLDHRRNVPGPLFEQEQDRLALAQTMHRINQKFGSKTVYVAAMHESRDRAPLRIAFTSIPDKEW